MPSTGHFRCRVIALLNIYGLSAAWGNEKRLQKSEFYPRRTLRLFATSHGYLAHSCNATFSFSLRRRAKLIRWVFDTNNIYYSLPNLVTKSGEREDSISLLFRSLVEIIFSLHLVVQKYVDESHSKFGQRLFLWKFRAMEIDLMKQVSGNSTSLWSPKLLKLHVEHMEVTLP